MQPTIVVDLPGPLADRLAVLLHDEAARAVAQRGRFVLAIPGGSVAEAFFPRLAAAPIDWMRLDLFWCDERAVPPGDAQSNYGLARRLLLDRIPLPPDRIHRMEGEAADRDAAAAACARALRAAAGEPPRLDAAVVGVGPDGHVASLFPGHPALEETRLTIAAVSDAPKPPPGRLTLTLPVLTDASLVVIAAFGGSKAEAIRAAIEDGRSALPVARLARGAARTLFLIDPAAASALGRSRR